MSDSAHRQVASVGRPALIAAAFVVFVCVSVIAVEAWNIEAARRTQIAEADAASTNLARSVAETMTNTFVQADLVLAGLVERIETDGIAVVSSERFHRLLGKRKSELAPIQRLSIIDAEGRWLVTDLADNDRRVEHDEREYFRYHRTHEDTGPHLGPPIRAKSTDEWIVTISRRINDAEGRFAGIVLASVSLSFFNGYFDQFDIGRQGTIVIATSDGTIIDRRPFRDDIVGTSIADGPLYREHIAFDDHGQAWIRGRFDGVERLVAFRQANGFPVYAIVAMSRDEILAPWIKDSALDATAALIFVALIGWVGSRLIRQTAARHREQLLLIQSQTALHAANERLQQLARTDGLTGIANRREFDRVLADELARAAREAYPIALVMIDIDHFKRYNDTSGHAQGDECLRRVATLVDAAATRPGDIAARYGGEEFAIVLAKTDVRGARHVAEKLRSAIHRTAVPHGASPYGIVTASIGIAAITPSPTSSDPTILIELADRALYAAKSAGRDTVRAHDEERTPTAQSPIEATASDGAR